MVLPIAGCVRVQPSGCGLVIFDCGVFEEPAVLSPLDALAVIGKAKPGWGDGCHHNALSITKGIAVGGARCGVTWGLMID